MWLDADDVVEDKDAAEICRLKEQMKDYDMAFLEYVIPGTDGRPLMCYCRERIFRRTQNYVWEGAVHEAISSRGRILYSSAKIVHKKVRPSQPMRNLRIYQKIILFLRKLLFLQGCDEKDLSKQGFNLILYATEY